MMSRLSKQDVMNLSFKLAWCTVHDVPKIMKPFNLCDNMLHIFKSYIAAGLHTFCIC